MASAGSKLRPYPRYQFADNGEQCFPDGTDPVSFWDTFMAREYESDLLDLIDRLCRPGSVFVDVGAWVGPFSLYAASRGTRVLAVEPDPVAWDRLVENVALNGWKDRVTIVPSAIVADSRIATLLNESHGAGLSFLSRTEGHEVARTTLPDLLRRHVIARKDVSLVKIDIEGYELTLLPTLAPWLAEHKIPVRVSLHGEWAKREWFSGFPTIVWPDTPYGDVVGLPFVTLNRKGLD